MKLRLVFLVNVLFCLSAYAQTSCSEDSVCRARADSFVAEFTRAMDDLGPFTPAQSDRPELKMDEKGSVMIKQQERWSDEQLRNLRKAMALVQELNAKSEYETKYILSITQENAMDWWNEFKDFYSESTQLPSPHFAKGSYVLLNLRPFGAYRPFQSGEGYSSSYDLTYGRTFKRKDPLKDRRLRWNAGLKLLYQTRETSVHGMLTLDWKITDIKMDALNVGLLKLSTQVFANGEITGGEVGIAIETYILGFNLLSIGYQNIDDDNLKSGVYFQSGILINLTDF